MGNNVARSFPDRVGDGVQFGDDFAERAIAAFRTYKARPKATSHFPVGKPWNELNDSVRRKRVLNIQREVTAADNSSKTPCPSSSLEAVW